MAQLIRASRMRGGEVANLGKQLRALFNTSESLPKRMMELLSALAAKDIRPAGEHLKADLLAAIPRLRAFAYSLSGNRDRADDLVQETMLKAWSHIDSFQPGTNLRAWLFTILRNSFLSDVRRRKREIEDAGGKIAGEIPVLPAQQGGADMNDMLKALDLLPPLQREAVVLVGAAGMSYEEAAQIANCAVGTIKSRVNRARVRLAEHLGMEDAAFFKSDVGE